MVRALKACGHSVSLTLRVSNPKMAALMKREQENQSNSNEDLSSQPTPSPPPLPSPPSQPVPLEPFTFERERTSSTPTSLPSRRPPIRPPAPSPTTEQAAVASGREEEKDGRVTNGWNSSHHKGTAYSQRPIKMLLHAIIDV